MCGAELEKTVGAVLRLRDDIVTDPTVESFRVYIDNLRATLPPIIDAFWRLDRERQEETGKPSLYGQLPFCLGNSKSMLQSGGQLTSVLAVAFVVAWLLDYPAEVPVVPIVERWLLGFLESCGVKTGPDMPALGPMPSSCDVADWLDSADGE